MFGKTMVRGLMAVALVASAMTGRADTITLDMVPVGDAGNQADTASHSGNTSGQGAVAYNYSIAKYDVTLTQYTAFLNAVASTNTDPYALYNPSMATDLNVAGIGRSGSPGSYSYSVIGSGQRPVTYVSWYDAIRFANWLSNGQGTLASTETGSYTITGGGPDSGTVTAPDATQRALWAAGGSGMHYLLPSEDEWYKAAYYKSGGTNAGYWKYPTKNDLLPSNVLILSGTNNANFYDSTNGYTVTQLTGHSSSQNYLTDVGAFSSSPGPYGTFDQGGDVRQWNEATIDGSFRGLRGGAWDYGYINLVSSTRESTYPWIGNDDLGFRVASVPEPGSIALLLAGAVAFGIWRQRRKAYAAA